MLSMSEENRAARDSIYYTAHCIYKQTPSAGFGWVESSLNTLVGVSAIESGNFLTRWLGYSPAPEARQRPASSVRSGKKTTKPSEWGVHLKTSQRTPAKPSGIFCCLIHFRFSWGWHAEGLSAKFQLFSRLWKDTEAPNLKALKKTNFI